MRCCVCLQASFDPPGLSIAVKKDRAVETLLVMGNKFNVNVLAQGKEKVLLMFSCLVHMSAANSTCCADSCVLLSCFALHNEANP